MIENETLATLVLSNETVWNTAYELEQLLAGKLKSPPVGIYLATQHDPIRESTLPFYVKGPGGEMWETDTPLEVRQDVYSRTMLGRNSYKCVIPGFFLRNRVPMVANTPFHPYMGFQIIRSLLNAEFAHPLNIDITERNNGFYLQFEGVETVSDDVVVGMDDEYVSSVRICMDLITEVNNFVGRYQQHIHSLTINPSSASVRRHPDHRVLLWLQHEAKLEHDRAMALQSNDQ